MNLRFAPLSLLLLLALPAAPAFGANANVNISDDQFDTSVVQINPGESVTWHWTGMDQHTVTARPFQTERFGSPFQTSGTFTHTFAKPGKFTYYCQVHSFMRATVEVGPAPFPDTSLPRATSVKAKARGHTGTVSFKLSETSRVKVTLSGPSKKELARKLGKGKRSLKFRHLKAGTYKVKLSLSDLAKNKGKAVKKSFKVR
jgi:plastocyanin